MFKIIWIKPIATRANLNANFIPFFYISNRRVLIYLEEVLELFLFGLHTFYSEKLI